MYLNSATDKVNETVVFLRNETVSFRGEFILCHYYHCNSFNAKTEYLHSVRALWSIATTWKCINGVMLLHSATLGLQRACSSAHWEAEVLVYKTRVQNTCIYLQEWVQSNSTVMHCLLLKQLITEVHYFWFTPKCHIQNKDCCNKAKIKSVKYKTETEAAAYTEIKTLKRPISK